MLSLSVENNLVTRVMVLLLKLLVAFYTLANLASIGGLIVLNV